MADNILSSLLNDPLDYLRPYLSRPKLEVLSSLRQQRLSHLQRPTHQHYRHILNALPLRPPQVDCDYHSTPFVQVGSPEQSPGETLKACAQQLIPWRKGPFKLFDVTIDGEWRSDLKWQRILPHLDPLANARVLDIGANNGYYMFKLLGQSQLTPQVAPQFILGLEPVLHHYLQFHLFQYYAQETQLQLELWGHEQLTLLESMFDLVLCMGIIYHARHPLALLQDIYQGLRPGGQLILETIGIPGEESYALFPEHTYAKMKNVWFVPTLAAVKNWIKRAHFQDIEVISASILTSDEQRTTPWCPPPKESLADFLNPQNPQQTIEGYPAPWRFCLKARKA